MNALVGETNDGTLNDIRGLHVTREHVTAAIANATTGAGRRRSRRRGHGHGRLRMEGRHRHLVAHACAQGNDTWTVGVLVQSNYGGKLVIDGVPVWKELTPPRERQSPARQSRDHARSRQTAPA